MLNKNETINLKIERLSSDGSGVGFIDGMAVFVPFSAAGDELCVKIVSVKKNYAFGIIQKITSPSPDRETPHCPLFGKCGGCAFQHLSRPAELNAKRGFVSDALKRIGGIEFDVKAVINAPNRYGYRNKVQFPAADFGLGLDCGLYAPRSHRAVPARECALQNELLNNTAAQTALILRAHGVTPYNEALNNGTLRHIYLRQSSLTGEIMLCLVINAQRLPDEKAIAAEIAAACPNVSSIHININTASTNVILGERQRLIYGSAAITDLLAGVKLQLQPKSFFQVNHAVAELLYAQIKRLAAPRPDETLLDLFCGAGSIGLSLAKDCKSVTGVEIVAAAIEDARKNAAESGLDNCEFIQADAEKCAQLLVNDSRRFDIVITDPPRKGCTPQTLELLTQLSPKRIIMVSCDPATLARDLKQLCAAGWLLREVQPVDMFPCTPHVETVVLITRVNE